MQMRASSAHVHGHIKNFRGDELAVNRSVVIRVPKIGFIKSGSIPDAQVLDDLHLVLSPILQFEIFQQDPVPSTSAKKIP